jgi:hypothetical protein
MNNTLNRPSIFVYALIAFGLMAIIWQKRELDRFKSYFEAIERITKNNGI